jgi:hypothetical protein
VESLDDVAFSIIQQPKELLAYRRRFLFTLAEEMIQLKYVKRLQLHLNDVTEELYPDTGR